MRFRVPLEALSLEMQQVDNHDMLFCFDGFSASGGGLRLTVTKIAPPEGRPTKRAKVAQDRAAEKEQATEEHERAAKVEQERVFKARQERAAQVEQERAAKVEQERAAMVEQERAAMVAQERAAKVAQERAAKVAQERAMMEQHKEAVAEQERADNAEHERAALDTLVQIVKWAAAPSDMRLRLLQWIKAKPDPPPALRAWVGLLDAFCAAADGGAGGMDAGAAGDAGRGARALEALAAHDRAVQAGQGDEACAARANLGACIDKAQAELPEGGAARMRGLVVASGTADVLAWSGHVRPSMEAFHLALQLPWVPRG
jgi:hypothetical protein